MLTCALYIHNVDICRIYRRTN